MSTDPRFPTESSGLFKRTCKNDEPEDDPPKNDGPPKLRERNDSIVSMNRNAAPSCPTFTDQMVPQIPLCGKPEKKHKKHKALTILTGVVWVMIGVATVAGTWYNFVKTKTCKIEMNN